MEKTEEWKKAYQESKLSKKTKIIILIIIVLVIAAFSYYQIMKAEEIKNVCKLVLGNMDNIANGTEVAYEEQLKYLCNATFNSSCSLNDMENMLYDTERYDSRYSVGSSFNYVSLAALSTLKEKTGYMNEIAKKEISNDCNIVTALSPALYQIFSMSGHGYAFGCRSTAMSKCTNQNITDDEKRGCLISLLNAEKSSVDYYLSLDYSVDVGECIKTINSEENKKLSIDIKAGSESFISESEWKAICQKFDEYKKAIVEKVRKSNMNENEKYTILISLYAEGVSLRDNFDEGLIERTVIERIDPKYQYLFEKTS